jgi:5-methylcytosine-specific restriction endonuclease McrA
MRDRFAILARDNFSCVYCGRNPTKHKAVLHVDHIIPKSKGGKDEAGNLIAACERCNLSKAAASTTTTSLFLAVAEERCKEIGISITLKVKI